MKSLKGKKLDEDNGYCEIKANLKYVIGLK